MSKYLIRLNFDISTCLGHNQSQKEFDKAAPICYNQNANFSRKGLTPLPICAIMGKSRAEQSRAEQSRAEQSRAEQSRAEQSRAEQS
ncbi:MAG: hypothetical protein FWG65_02770, partial [Turicibacter sp.]|nr:hypothetical protein [Turicibacter sp.]